MGIDLRKPHVALSQCVAQLWHCEGYELEHAWERIMPSTGTTLLVNLGSDELRWRAVGGPLERIRGLGICGPQPAPIEIDTAQQRFILGVEFQPAGASGTLRIAANEIAATHVALVDLIGREAGVLHGRLVDARSAARRFEIVEAWLLARLAQANGRRGAASHALPLLERMSVAQVGERMGLAPKRLIRAFRLEVGLAPKLFCRVRRFERLLAAIEGQSAVDWAALGAWHGYYDQAHLVHEFRSLAGVSPSEYLVRRGPTARHVRLGE